MAVVVGTTTTGICICEGFGASIKVINVQRISKLYSRLLMHINKNAH